MKLRNIVLAGLVLALGASAAQANVVFTFTEVGGTVEMTSSGVLDTTKLVSVSRIDGWAGTGTENNSTPGDIDIMGGTDVGGPIDAQFGFNVGTDISDIVNPGGPFAFSNFSVSSVTGSNAFTTYSGFIGDFRQAGIGMTASDIIGGLWTPDQNWTYLGESFASLGLNIGTYAVSDSLTGETITIQVGAAEPAAVPEPASLALLGLGLFVFGISRRKKA